VLRCSWWNCAMSWCKGSCGYVVCGGWLTSLQDEKLPHYEETLRSSIMDELDAFKRTNAEASMVACKAQIDELYAAASAEIAKVNDLLPARTFDAVASAAASCSVGAHHLPSCDTGGWRGAAGGNSAAISAFLLADSRIQAGGISGGSAWPCQAPGTVAYVAVAVLVFLSLCSTHSLTRSLTHSLTLPPPYESPVLFLPSFRFRPECARRCDSFSLSWPDLRRCLPLLQALMEAVCDRFPPILLDWMDKLTSAQSSSSTMQQRDLQLRLNEIAVLESKVKAANDIRAQERATYDKSLSEQATSAAQKENHLKAMVRYLSLPACLPASLPPFLPPSLPSSSQFRCLFRNADGGGATVIE
jgi:hypothetical protein